MTKEMEYLIRNVPIVETRGSYVINAFLRQNIPVLTVYSKDDDRKSVHLCIDPNYYVITLVPSLVCKFTDVLWDTILGLLHECGTCDERNRIIKYASMDDLIQGLDHFLELLETL